MNKNKFGLEARGRFKSIRIKKGFSQKKLARAIDQTQTAIAHFESGRTDKPKWLPDACAVLGISYDYLITGNFSYSETGPMNPAAGQDPAPLYGFGHGGIVHLNEESIMDRLPRRTPNMGPEGFYMIVPDDSMEPKYEQGERIAVSKSMPPRKGRDCVIELIDGTALIRRFSGMTENNLECEQMNPRKKITMNRAEILGVYAIISIEMF